MQDKSKLKVEGIRFAKSLQMTVRMATAFTATHPSAQLPMQKTFDLLNALVKQTSRYTFGFKDGRVILNNLMVNDGSLAQLENEFLKRGFGGLTFEAGLTLAAFKRAMAVISAPIAAIEQAGGPRAFLDQNRIESISILLAGKNQVRTAEGDTVLESDPESVLRAEEKPDAPQIAGLEALSILIESAGMERPGNLGHGGPAEFIQFVGPAVERALIFEGGSPEKSYNALATLLEQVSPQLVLSQFPAERREQLKNMPPAQVAMEFIEDRAVNWAVQRLTSTTESSEKFFEVEEDVMRVLVRSLKATQMADRLAEKLAKFVEDMTIPRSTYEKVRAELRWTGLSPSEKQKELLATPRYDATQFRRLMEHMRQLLAQGQVADATALAKHYFEFLSAPEVLHEEMSRAPEVINAIAAVHSDFAQNTAERLKQWLARSDLNEFLHFQFANALAALARGAARFEQYDLILGIGSALENRMAGAPEQHQECCRAAIRSLLPNTAVERVIEIYLHKRGDSAWAKTASSLLRMLGTAGADKVFQRLEAEPLAQNRFSLLRLLGQIGSPALDAIRQRLKDERWFVVRNACVLLGEMKDPDLLQQLRPLLSHSDGRVQESAANVLIKSRMPMRSLVLADNLQHLRGNVLEQALTEIMFQRDPDTLPALEEFIFSHRASKDKSLALAVQVVAVLPGDRPIEILAKLLMSTTPETAIHKSALAALRTNKSEAGQKFLREFLNRAAGETPGEPTRPPTIQ